VAPVYSQARLMYERMRRALPPENRETNETNMTISVKVGPPRGWATIHFKSGDRYDALYGAEVGACVIDEASRTREDVFFAVRSTLTATNGPLRAIGNVKGRKNWFYHQCRVAEQGAVDAKYARFTSDDAIKADIVKATEIEDAKRLLPEAVFRELYYAEPSDDGGNPFGLQHIAACVKPISTKPPRCFGVDFGKHEDYTVIIGLDEDGCVCRFDRWKDMPWPETISRVKSMCGHHKTLLDASGVGDPVVDQLQHEMGSCYQGFKFTWSSKQELMTGLAVAIQSRKVGFPDGIIRQELDSFEYSVKTSEGRVTSVSMSAPPRCHDDCVASLALAVSLFPKAITVWDRLGTPEEVKRFETATTDLERLAGRWRGLDGERGILQ
ncbi:MAG: hypothetical protein KGJ13_04750, partial [Patescibacteria group bacterium]|nr:hypothetical protein [Patescibacteria group bacterium]